SSRGAAMAGPLFEALATLGVRVSAEAVGARVGHLRTKKGDHEIDLVVEGFDDEVLGIEMKLSAYEDEKTVRHLRWFREQLDDSVTDLIVISNGNTGYRRRDGVSVVPRDLVGARIGSKPVRSRISSSEMPVVRLRPDALSPQEFAQSLVGNHETAVLAPQEEIAVTAGGRGPGVCVDSLQPCRQGQQCRLGHAVLQACPRRFSHCVGVEIASFVQS